VASVVVVVVTEVTTSVWTTVDGCTRVTVLVVVWATFSQRTATSTSILACDHTGMGAVTVARVTPKQEQALLYLTEPEQAEA